MRSMPNMTFIMPDGKEILADAPLGLSVMEIAHHNKIYQIEGTCGGSLACATCHVYVHPDWFNKVLPEEGDISEDEEDMLDLAFDLKKSSRLSCQIIMEEELDGLVVALPGSRPDWV
jgi:2Fe-2S ferredoxin